MSGSVGPLRAASAGSVAGDGSVSSESGTRTPTRRSGVRLDRRALLGAALLSIVLVIVLGLARAHTPVRTPIVGTPVAHSGRIAHLGVLGHSGRAAHPGGIARARLSSEGNAGAASLPVNARAPVSAALGASGAAYHVSPAAGGFQAASGPQRLRARFDRAGIQIGSGTMRLSVGTATLGAGAYRQTLAGAAPHASANRVTYTRGPVSEWYANGPLGLEQGFTITRAPAPGNSATPMTLAMTVAGNARAAISAGSESVTFARAGSPSLRYYDLTATDASGRTLHSWLTLQGDTLLLHVDTRGAAYPLEVDPLIALSEQLTGSGSGEQGAGHFGFSVALSADGDTALIGAPNDERHGGTVSVFVRSGSSWIQQGTLTGEEGGAEDNEAQCIEEPGEEVGGCHFGASVALSADGDVALVGAPYADGQEGAAWVFRRSGSTWSEQGEELTGGAEEVGSGRFGRAVALSSSGEIALIGAPADNRYHGAAWTFTHSESGSGWSQSETLTAAGVPHAGHFGHSVALSSDGDTALVGAPATGSYVGAALAFTRTGTASSWGHGEELIAADELGSGHFGSSVALSGDGATALVGGRVDNDDLGAVWAFDRAGGSWSSGEKLTAGASETEAGQFGSSVALSGDGDLALVGAPHNEADGGQVWVLTRSGDTWTQGETLEVPEEAAPSRFGASTALSSSGVSAVIGASLSDKGVGEAWATGPAVAPLPTVTRVTPTSGPAAGGTTVKIEGTGFLEGASVEIGSRASSVEVLSETEITATTSAAAPGEDEVVVSDSNGTSTGGPRFTYLPPPPPVVTSVVPSSGPTTGGTEVKIQGSGFLPGASVDIGPAASSVKVVSETEIVATTSSALPGEDEVVVTDANGSSSGGPRFTYEEPTSPSGTTGGTASGTASPTAKSGVLGTTTTALPAPQLTVNANLSSFSGTVLVKLPGSSTFVALSSIKQIPFGTIINATNGSVTITTILPNGKTQTITLYSGEFMLTQQHNGTVLITLEGGNFSVCPTAKERSHTARTSSTHASGSHVVRKLWANGHGKYTTKGNYASGAVQGTVWLTEDLCDGTLITVTRDSVLVTNLVNHKHFLIKAPHHYLAKAP